MHAFTDQFYSSSELAETLYDYKIHLNGTLNRTQKAFKKKKKLTKGNVNAFRKGVQ